MRAALPQRPPTCLTIAGSDSGGGAGIQADLKAMEAAGAFGTSAITAVTAQHTRGVERSFILPLEVIRAQIEAVRSDIDIAAVKTGMLASVDVIELVVEEFGDTDRPLVVDPVMIAASGDRLLDEAAESVYPSLIQSATLVTPNTDEASVLVDASVDSVPEAVDAGEELVAMGAEAALVKGGHLTGETVTDVLVTGDRVREFERDRIDSAATHGSGCMLASTITARLASGDDLPGAVAASLAIIDRAVQYPIDVGAGHGTVHHLADVRNRADRGTTVEAVHGIVQTLVGADVSPLVPDAGMNVVGVTPFGTDMSDTVAVDGRLTRTSMGVRSTAGVAFGGAGDLGRLLLDLRDTRPAVRFAIDCRYDDVVATAVEQLDWDVVKSAEIETIAEGEPLPDAIIDQGEAPVTLVPIATQPAALRDRTLTLMDAIEHARQDDPERSD